MSVDIVAHLIARPDLVWWACKRWGIGHNDGRQEMWVSILENAPSFAAAKCAPSTWLRFNALTARSRIIASRRIVYFHSGTPPKSIELLQKREAARRVVSLRLKKHANALIAPEIDTAPDVSPELTRVVHESLLCLTHKERSILEHRYGIGMDDRYTLEECGRIFRVSPERVRQIEVKALRKLQHPVRIGKLQRFANA